MGGFNTSSEETTIQSVFALETATFSLRRFKRKGRSFFALEACVFEKKQMTKSASDPS